MNKATNSWESDEKTKDTWRSLMNCSFIVLQDIFIDPMIYKYSLNSSGHSNISFHRVLEGTFKIERFNKASYRSLLQGLLELYSYTYIVTFRKKKLTKKLRLKCKFLMRKLQALDTSYLLRYSTE